MQSNGINRWMGMGVLALAAFALGVGCRDGGEASEPSRVSLASEALANAVAACGEQLSACASEARGDQTVLAACRANFGACRETAGMGSMSDLADAIQACTDGARECARAAGGADAKSCHEELVSCLGASRPEPPAHPEHDGGGRPDGAAPAAGDHGSPVAACIDTLLECVHADGSAKQCAHALRACIVDAVPAPDGAIPEDPGSAAGDHRPDDVPAHGDAGMAGDPPRADAAMGMPDDVPPADPGMGMAGDPPGADAGMGMAPATPAACMEQLEACLAAGGARSECARQLRECRGKD